MAKTWEQLRKEYPSYREEMTENQERNFVEDLFDRYEADGFSEEFKSPFTFTDEILLETLKGDDRYGKPFKVIGRCDENKCGLESLPMWDIQFEDGAIIAAYPEEIIFSLQDGDIEIKDRGGRKEYE